MARENEFSDLEADTRFLENATTMLRSQQNNSDRSIIGRQPNV